MPFVLEYTPVAQEQYEELEARATKAAAGRGTTKGKSSKDEGLFKQMRKALRFLQKNPKHPGLNTHEYDSLEHPFDRKEKVWEAYAQNNTPGAYRVFWCYGPTKGTITVMAITPHP